MKRSAQPSLPFGADNVRIGSLFSGIGGLELGVEAAICAMGGRAQTAWQAEINPYSRAVLAQHWPTARRFDDARIVGAKTADPVSWLLMGTPCQDISKAAYRWGRKGLGGERSGLWSEAIRVTHELGPDMIVWENVGGATCPLRDKKRVVGPSPLGVVLADLDDDGYDAYFTSMLAAGLGASHLRLRVFVVAWRRDRRELRFRLPSSCGHSLNINPSAFTARMGERPRKGEPERAILSSSEVPFHMERVEADGNAVVPQCGYAIGTVAMALRRFFAGDAEAMRRAERLGSSGVDRESVPRTTKDFSRALADEALGLVVNRTPSSSFGSVRDLDEAAAACAAGRVKTPKLCGSWPGVGVVIDGDVRIPPNAPRLTGAFACRLGEDCDGADPVDATEARYYPTITARDWRSGKASDATRERNSRPLSEVAAPEGFINPDWADMHMGFPVGWTELTRPTLAPRKRGSKPY